MATLRVMTIPSPEWDPENIVANLELEIEHDNELSGAPNARERLGERSLRHAAPIAVKSLLHLAVYASKEETRLRAAETILNRVYGSAASNSFYEGSGEDAYEKVLREVLSPMP